MTGIHIYTRAHARRSTVMNGNETCYANEPLDRDSVSHQGTSYNKTVSAGTLLKFVDVFYHSVRELNDSQTIDRKPARHTLVSYYRQTTKYNHKLNYISIRYLERVSAKV